MQHLYQIYLSVYLPDCRKVYFLYELFVLDLALVPCLGLLPALFVGAVGEAVYWRVRSAMKVGAANNAVPPLASWLNLHFRIRIYIRTRDGDVIKFVGTRILEVLLTEGGVAMWLGSLPNQGHHVTISFQAKSNHREKAG